MPTSRRIARLEQLVLETVAVAIQREVHDPRVGIVTVTRVKLSSDLTAATVWWSCLGDDAQKRTTARGLAAATHVLQSHVAGAMGTRVTPKLTLRFDAGLEKAQRLEGIFAKLRAERGEPAPAPESESPEPTEPEDDAAPDEAAPEEKTPDGDEPEGEPR